LKEEIENLLFMQIFKNKVDAFLINGMSLSTQSKGESLFENGYVDLLEHLDQKDFKQKTNSVITFLVRSETRRSEQYEVLKSFNPLSDKTLPKPTCKCPLYARSQPAPCKHIAAALLYLQYEFEKILEEKDADFIFESLDLDGEQIKMDAVKKMGGKLEQLAKTMKTQKIPTEMAQPELKSGFKDFMYKENFTSWEVMEKHFKLRHEVNKFPKINYQLTQNQNGKIWEYINKKTKEGETIAEMIGNNTIRVSNNMYGTNPEKGLIPMLAIQLAMVSQLNSPKWHRQFNDHSKEKNEVLAQFGLDVNDPLANEFLFDFDYHGNYKIIKAPVGLIKLSKYQSGDLEALQSTLNIEPDSKEKIENLKHGNRPGRYRYLFQF